MTRTRFLIGVGYSYLSLGFQRPFVQRKKSGSYVVLFGPDKAGKW